MKNLEALLPVAQAPEIIDQLCQLEVETLITSNVNVFDQGPRATMTFRGCTYEEKFCRKVKVEVSVSDRDFSSAESLLLGSA